MTRKLIISLSLNFLTLSSFGQPFSKQDSISINDVIGKVFKVFEIPTVNQFNAISTKSIYCIICFSAPDSRKKPYMLSREKFFAFLSSKKFLEKIKLAQQSSEIIYTKSDSDYRSDVIVLFTIPNKLESTLNEQLGIYLKRGKGGFKFSGIEVIP